MSCMFWRSNGRLVRKASGRRRIWGKSRITKPSDDSFLLQYMCTYIYIEVQSDGKCSDKNGYIVC